METIITAVITGGLALIGVIFTNIQSNRAIENNLKVSQAVTTTKIENLTEEVRKHNNFAIKIPVLENKIANVERDIQELKRAE